VKPKDHERPRILIEYKVVTCESMRKIPAWRKILPFQSIEWADDLLNVLNFLVNVFFYHQHRIVSPVPSLFALKGKSDDQILGMEYLGCITSEKTPSWHRISDMQQDADKQVRQSLKTLNEMKAGNPLCHEKWYVGWVFIEVGLKKILAFKVQ